MAKRVQEQLEGMRAEAKLWVADHKSREQQDLEWKRQQEDSQVQKMSRYEPEHTRRSLTSMDQAMVLVEYGNRSYTTPLWVVEMESKQVETVIGVTTLEQVGVHVVRFRGKLCEGTGVI